MTTHVKAHINDWYLKLAVLLKLGVLQAVVTSLREKIHVRSFAALRNVGEYGFGR
jgi:hypothetical protein